MRERLVTSFTLSPIAQANLEEAKSSLGVSKSSYAELAIFEQSIKYRALGYFSDKPQELVAVIHLLEQLRKILMGKSKSHEWAKHFKEVFAMLGFIGVEDKDSAQRFYDFLKDVIEEAEELQAEYAERWELES